MSEPRAPKKNYVLDTNVLIENPQSLLTLRNGAENNIFIPYHVLMELEGLKKTPKLRHIVSTVIQLLMEHRDKITFIKNDKSRSQFTDIVDNHILEEIASGGIENPILVTNDRILQLQAGLAGIVSEELRDSKPFESESQRYTGFAEEGQPPVPNSFSWQGGKPVLHAPDGDKTINYTCEVWNIKPRTVYQNLALELVCSQHIDLVSIQSEAGYGKTYLALASALYAVQEKKLFDKIYVLKPTIEIGAKMGYLPGDVSEKMEPYMKYIYDLLVKLHKSRAANKVFLNPNDDILRINPKKFEILPLAYVRGMNIENAFVIIDEAQNLSRTEVRAILTRMGEGVKCLCLGDTSQVDNPYLNESNNGLNWIVRKFKGLPNYGHIVLKGDKSRGPITDMVLKSRL
ncbi:PhoH family protein [Desulfolutivibrio sulfoxidireducens]|uniref:PhoH family protein n=1 Tax=Desulfolutivibrio sulfoxidireducens TaxID=2773299 RepID=UPI00159D0144|nr:PhoH family protein [Desulfolutivibrio sulfoxidireducens]QLA17733.1 AAA family ATPase [Desulfolutivibrio sulfoxidireducens]QLA21307.1 AAA family ATPase [Desulfolutivibrio sulfoxidireducens]